jgi:tetratricopeptide (TPR) repeat protein
LGGVTWEGVLWAFTKVHSGHWHPLTWLSLMLDVQVFGLSPFAMRVENVIFHAFSAVLLCAALRTLSFGNLRALFAAAVFAVHPLRLESVLWVSQRKDVLALVAFSLALACYARYLDGLRKSWWWGSAGALCLGLLAKPTLVVAPFLFFLVEWFLSKNRRALREILFDTAPLLLISLAVAVAAVIGQEAAGGLKAAGVLGIEARVTNAATGYLIYLGRLFWPVHLGIFYPLRDLPGGLGAGAIVALLVITGWAFYQRTLRPYLLFSWLWFLIALLPIIGLIQVGWQQVADRWTYLPHVGLIIGVSALGEEMCGAWRRSLTVMACALVLGLAVLTRLSVPMWLSSAPLFTHTLKVAPDNFFISTNLGVVYERMGRRTEAFEQYEEALRVNPRYATALNNAGAFLATDGRIAESVSYFQKALDSSPDYGAARYHLGLAFYHLQQPGAALREWARLVAREPYAASGRTDFMRLAQGLLQRGCDGTWGEAISPGLSDALSRVKDQGLEELASKLRSLRCVG